MATQLFLISTIGGDPGSDYSTGNNDARLNGTTSGWVNKRLGTGRIGSQTSHGTLTVAGPTNGVEVAVGTATVAFISAPLDADVTISGSITWNLWASESNMAANASINGILEVIDGATGAITLIDKTARTIELGTSAAAANFAETPAAGIACKRGDRLRARVFGDDTTGGGSGDMVSGHSFDFFYSALSEGVLGDSYLTLTEDLTFVSEPAGSQIFLTDTAGLGETVSDTGFTAGGTYENVDRSGAAAWSNPSNAAVSDDVFASALNAGSGTDYLVCRNLGLSIPAGSAIRGVEVEVEWNADTGGQKMTAQLQDDAGALIGSSKDTESAGGAEIVHTLGGQDDNWGAMLTEAIAEDPDFGVRIWSSFALANFTVDRIRVKVYYAPANKNREAWTSRGAGVQTDVTNTVAGWTAPIQITDTAGGTVVDWFTKPLTAFTLGGAVRCNVRAKENSTSQNAGLRLEISVVNGDGTNPITWAAASTVEAAGAGEAAVSFLVAGDDVAVSDGQRLRIRAYVDDSPDAPILGGGNMTLYYAGTSGGASGDTFLTFSQTLTEAAAAAGRVPKSTPYPQLLAH